MIFSQNIAEKQRRKSTIDGIARTVIPEGMEAA